MSQDHRNKVLRHLSRAKAVMAKSLFSELRRSGFEDGDVIDFVGEVLRLLSEERYPEDNHGPDEDVQALRPDSGLPSEQAFKEILDFELRQGRRNEGRRPITLVMLEPKTPTWAKSQLQGDLHRAVASALVRKVRLADPVARLDDGGYAIALVGSAEAAAESLQSRVFEDLASIETEVNASLSEGMELGVRVIKWDGEDASAETLLARCREAPATTVRIAPGGASPRQSKKQAGMLRRSSDTHVVLALGGGAARAAAHIGVIEALRSSGIHIAGVAGTSAGSLVAAMLATGVRPSDMLERFVEFRKSSLYRKLRRSYVASKGALHRRRDPFFQASSLEFLSSDHVSFLSAEECAEFVRFFVAEDRDIATLRLPFGSLATDLVEGCNVSLTHGSLHQSLRAACALPGLFPPVPMGERMLIDGSTLAEVPIQAAASLSQHPVLAIHLERPDTRPLGFGNSLEIGVRTSSLLHRELLREQLTNAHLLLSIPVSEYGWFDFASAPEVAEVGRKAAETALNG